MQYKYYKHRNRRTSRTENANFICWQSGKHVLSHMMEERPKMKRTFIAKFIKLKRGARNYFTSTLSSGRRKDGEERTKISSVDRTLECH